MPVVKSYCIEDYFYNKIKDILKLNNLEINLGYNLSYSGIIENVFKNNLRNIKRFLNQFYADYNMIKDYKEDIDIDDFILIEIVKHFENRLYNFIKESKNDFINMESEIRADDELSKNLLSYNRHKEFIEKELKNMKCHNRLDILVIIINRLFPRKITEEFSNTSHKIEKVEIKPSNRINDPKSFDKYFRLDIK